MTTAYEFGYKFAVSVPDYLPLPEIIDNIKNRPDLAAADQPGFANSFQNPTTRNLLWQAAGLSPLMLSAGGLYLLAKPAPKPKKNIKRLPAPQQKVATDWRSILQEAQRQLPGIHPVDIGAGALGGAALGGLYDVVRGNSGRESNKNRWRQTLRRVLTGALVGGAGANLAGDRVRRHISNTLVPFGYGGTAGGDKLKSVTPTSLQDLYHTAILDEPGYKEDAVKNLHGPNGEYRLLPELAARRELMRRSFGVHTADPIKDWWQKNKGGYYSLNEQHPTYEQNLRDIMGPMRRTPYVKIDDGFVQGTGIGLHDFLQRPEETLDAINNKNFVHNQNVAMGQQKDRYDFTDNMDMFSAWQVMGNQQVPYKKDPATGTIYMQPTDRYDITLSPHESKHLQDYGRNLFNKKWKNTATNKDFDYMPAYTVKNEEAGKSMIGRWLYDNVLSNENPWISQKVKLSPVSPARQAELGAVSLNRLRADFDRPFSVDRNNVPYQMQFLRENNTPAGPAIDSTFSAEEWARSKSPTPTWTADEANDYPGFSR